MVCLYFKRTFCGIWWHKADFGLFGWSWRSLNQHLTFQNTSKPTILGLLSHNWENVYWFQLLQSSLFSVLHHRKIANVSWIQFKTGNLNASPRWQILFGTHFMHVLVKQNLPPAVLSSRQTQVLKWVVDCELINNNLANQLIIQAIYRATHAEYLLFRASWMLFLTIQIEYLWGNQAFVDLSPCWR